MTTMKLVMLLVTLCSIVVSVMALCEATQHAFRTLLALCMKLRLYLLCRRYCCYFSIRSNDIECDCSIHIWCVYVYDHCGAGSPGTQNIYTQIQKYTPVSLFEKCLTMKYIHCIFFSLFCCCCVCKHPLLSNISVVDSRMHLLDIKYCCKHSQ